jgi:hypothetical protein
MRKSLVIIFGMIGSLTKAQIPVEIFGGHEKTTVDIMFFKYFKNKQGDTDSYQYRWLFFNRNRANIDYRMTKTTFLPQFGFTEAISYNHEKLKGFAPVVVGQVLSWGVYAKAGIQYAHIKKDITIFTWLVCETLKKPDLDYFLLFRYKPKLTEKINLFTQVESVNAFPTVRTDNYSFTQRLRLGLSIKSYQFGAATDFNQTGNSTFAKTYNIGCFIRHEF